MRPVAFLFMDESPLLRRMEKLLRSCHVAAVSSNCETETRQWLSRPGVDMVIREGGEGEASLEAFALERGVSMVSVAPDSRDGEMTPADERRLEDLLRALPTTACRKRQPDSFDELMGNSEVMFDLVEQLLRMAPSYAPILISGESGTGKGMAALAIHDRGRNREGPFVAVNCGAIPANLVESHLFGHEKGSFTGAHRRHAGVFEQAGRGTLFLDEVTSLSQDAQVKLLRVLEAGEVTRVGGERPIPLHCRIVTATNVCPEAAVKSSRLREDLFYRLGVLRLSMPPLRQRDGDVMELAEHFTSALSRDEGWSRALSGSARDRLTAHLWPGNVRELRNTLHSAVVLSRGDLIGEDDLSLSSPARAPRSDHLKISVGVSVEEVERRLIMRTLAHLDGDKARAARMLGISLKTLYNRLHAYGEMLPRAAATREST